MITLGHLSDLHATDPSDAAFGDLLNKRLLGWLSWRIRRRKRYRPEVLDALIADLHEQAPDQVAITGDLTNIGLKEEFEVAARVLERIGPPDRVSTIPGNHDAYVPVGYRDSWGLWADYLESDRDAPTNPVQDWIQMGNECSNMFAYSAMGPSVRIRGDLALVGVSTAIPTPPLFAKGEVGSQQCERLERVLADLGERGLCRVVLVHHPVLPQDDSFRRGMRDVARFREVVTRAGAELVLHGHDHQTRVGRIGSEGCWVPVVGVRSSSYGGSNPDKSSHYHLYEIERVGEAGANDEAPRYHIRLRARRWDRDRGVFVDAGVPELLTSFIA